MTLILWLDKKSYSFHYFLESTLFHQLWQTWMHVTISFFSWLSTINIFFSLGEMTLMLWLDEKSFFFLQFWEWILFCQSWQTWMHVIISIFFVVGNTIIFFPWDTRYWCFGFARKAFLSIIFLIINVHSWNEKTRIPVIISILFVMGTTIKFFSLGCTIWMLWI